MTFRARYLRFVPRIGAEWAVYGLVTAVGILGILAPDSRLRGSPRVDLQALFGALLVSSVVVQFYLRIRHRTGPDQSDVRALVRYLSRLVYLVLGALALFQGLSTSSVAGLQPDFAYALIALVAIRAMALIYEQRARRH